MRKIVAITLLLLFSVAVRSQTHQATGGTIVIGGPTGQSTIALPSSAALLGTDANGLPLAISMAASDSAVSRSLSRHFSDTANVLDYGALGTGSTATIGTTYGSTLAAIAAYTSGGVTPYAWMTNPNYGLTFSMATSSAQSSAGTTLTFLETISSGYSTTAALWQDPAHGNYQLRAGMLVSGTCIAPGTTLSSVDRNPLDMGYGTITLSAPTSTACASGASITFTTSSAQVQAMTYDYLGVQSAIAYGNSRGSGQGSVYAPCGTYKLSNTLVNANGNYQGINFRGDGVYCTHFDALSDFGADGYLLVEATGSGGNPSTYHDFTFWGPRVNTAQYVAPNQMSGLGVGGATQVYRYEADFAYAGLGIVNDHQVIKDSKLSNNYVGIRFRSFGATFGNQVIEDVELAGNEMCGIDISQTNSFDSGEWSRGHTGYGPMGICRLDPLQPATATMVNGVQVAAAPYPITNPPALLTQTQINNVPMEALGPHWLYGPNPQDAVSGNIFRGGGGADIGVGNLPSGYTVSVFQANGGFSGNSLYGTALAGQMYAATHGIIESGGGCDNNMFSADATIINGNGSKNFFACGEQSSNTFDSANASGYFATSTAAITAGMPLADFGITNTDHQVGPFVTGRPFAGISLYGVAPNTNFPVVTKGLRLALYLAPATPTAYTNIGDLLIPTPAGFQRGVGQVVAISKDGTSGYTVNASMGTAIFPAGAGFTSNYTNGNTDLNGEVTLAGGTFTYTFTNTTYNSHPICTANDTSGLTNVKVTYGGATSVTFTGTGADVIDYVCSPRN